MAKDPIKTLEQIEKRLDRRVARILNEIAFKIQDRVDSQEFIHWRTRRKPIIVEKARLVGHVMTATIRTASRWTWGHVLVGPPGETIIRPKRGKFLAVPLEAAESRKFKTKTLGPRHYGGLIFIGGILYGRAGWTTSGIGGYVRERRMAGEKFKKLDLIPLFILKGSIVVRRKVNTVMLQNWGNRRLMEALKKANLLKP